ncbi:Unknown protein, partial [Striga hermonthica]
WLITRLREKRRKMKKGRKRKRRMRRRKKRRRRRLRKKMRRRSMRWLPMSRFTRRGPRRSPLRIWSRWLRI